MKILYLTKNYKTRCDSKDWYLQNQLAKIENVVFYGPEHPKFPFLRRWDGPKIIQHVYANGNPDVILVDHYWGVARRWKNLYKIEIPKVAIISDPHHKPLEKINFIRKNRIELALFVIKHSIKAFKDRIDCSVGWLPWSVDTSVFRDYGFKRKYDVTFLGSVNPYYPLRQRILETLSKIPNINFFTKKHPGQWGLNPRKHLIREKYAKVITQSKILIFGTSILNYPVSKFFEGMACNTLVMAPMPLDGEDLHFHPGFNFVEINKENFVEKIKYYLRHENERQEIAKRGVETVKRYHTVEIRAKQLVDYLTNIIGHSSNNKRLKV
jgi:spore maturation protein CgeB